MELKLILSSTVKGWNLSENFIAEKNLSNEPWEFGYALGTSRPLAFKASARPCVFCRQNFAVGAEMYGGLGDRYSFGWKQTSQYLAPTVSFDIPKGPTLTFSPSFGLNSNSVGVIYRFKVSYEIQQIFSRHSQGGELMAPGKSDSSKEFAGARIRACFGSSSLRNGGWLVAKTCSRR